MKNLDLGIVLYFVVTKSVIVQFQRDFFYFLFLD